MRHTLLALAFLAAAGLAPAADANPPLLLQQPAVSKTHIAFGFAGDLWVVGRDGGDARRLTHNGETRTVAEWAAPVGILSKTIYGRLARGLPFDEGLRRRR